jgi:hypothetical protein
MNADNVSNDIKSNGTDSIASINSATEINQSKFNPPDDVADYIFISRYFCDATNAVLQTIHNDIEVLCANNYTTNVDNDGDRRVLTEMSNVFRRVYNSNQNDNNKLKIKLSARALDEIQTYFYSKKNNMFEPKGVYKAGKSDWTEGSAFIKRSDLIKRGLLRQPLTKTYSEREKLNYFYTMIMLANYDDKRSKPYNTNYTEILNILQSLVDANFAKTQQNNISQQTSMDGWKQNDTWTGGKRSSRRQSKRKTKSTKRTKRRRGTRKRTNKKR